MGFLVFSRCGKGCGSFSKNPDHLDSQKGCEEQFKDADNQDFRLIRRIISRINQINRPNSTVTMMGNVNIPAQGITPDMNDKRLLKSSFPGQVTCNPKCYSLED